MDENDRPGFWEAILVSFIGNLLALAVYYVATHV